LALPTGVKSVVKSSSIFNKRLRDERKAKGQVEVRVWVHPDDKPALVEKAVVLNRRRRDV